MKREAISENPVFVASDHAGFDLKEWLKGEFLEVKWVDLGPTNDQRVDYPDYASNLCEEMLKHPEAKGLLICGSGQGMAMRANKYPHIRGALAWSEESARLAREHNDANVLCLGSRLLERPLSKSIVRIFLSTAFAGGRHLDRVQKISLPV